MKINKGGAVRWTAGIVGGLMLAGVGSAALAAFPDAEDSGDVDVKVDIAQVAGGALSLTIAGTETTLTENGTTATEPVFTGELPEATVTDTRDDAAAGAFGYVTGQAGDLLGATGQANTSAAQLGR